MKIEKDSMSYNIFNHRGVLNLIWTVRIWFMKKFKGINWLGVFKDIVVDSWKGNYNGCSSHCIWCGGVK